jgi:predicted membrane-bound spermidine synthase
MKELWEAKLLRIRETDAFLAVRIEVLLGLGALTTVAGLVLFLWHAMISEHPRWVIATSSTLLGILLGIPIGRFLMPVAVRYIRSLSLKMQTVHPPGPRSKEHPS